MRFYEPLPEYVEMLRLAEVLVSTLLEILPRRHGVRQRLHQPIRFQPFLRFYMGTKLDGKVMRQVVSTLLEILLLIHGDEVWIAMYRFQPFLRF
ncbi:MAG: hypothetical protein ACO2PN_09220 [Pyrobaculum sp.]